jgi:cytoskeletal protein RodZ
MKMEKQTVGEFFRESRKEKEISMDEIVRDTNIPKRYLEAIETDQFDVFPGDTYAIGFISNYAEALELDKEFALSLYKRQIKIEQDAPIEQLVGKTNHVSLNTNSIFMIGVVASAVFIILIVSIIMRSVSEKSDKENAAPKVYNYTGEDAGKVSVQKFKIGDTINISNSNYLTTIKLISMGEGKSVNAKINSADYVLKNNELAAMDVDNNGTNDLSVELFNAKEKDIRISITILRENPEASSTNSYSTDDIYNKYKEYILSETELLNAPTKSLVEMKITGLGYGWLSFQPDNKEEKSMVINNASTFNISFNNSLVLYLGNSGAAKIAVGNKEEAGGGWGEISKSIFYWKSKNNQFALVRAILK